MRWLVDFIEGHENPHRDAMSTAQETRAVSSACKYRILWLKIPPIRTHMRHVSRFFAIFQMSLVHTSNEVVLTCYTRDCELSRGEKEQ